jgi:two-component system chemotaxis response regulator CheB
VIAVAASAGGIVALTTLLTGLAPDLPAAMLIVQHLDPEHRSYMPQILERRTGHRVREAREGDPLLPGRIYVAPPDRHLLVSAGGRVVLLSSSPRVHYVRPSADLLFQSVAEVCRKRAIAVVLTGSGSDGADGTCDVKRAGGTVIVQDPRTSEFSGMPTAAVNAGCVDDVLPLGQIAEALSSRLIGLGSDLRR